MHCNERASNDCNLNSPDHSMGVKIKITSATDGRWDGRWTNTLTSPSYTVLKLKNYPHVITLVYWWGLHLPKMVINWYYWQLRKLLTRQESAIWLFSFKLVLATACSRWVTCFQAVLVQIAFSFHSFLNTEKLSLEITSQLWKLFDFVLCAPGKSN